MTANIVTIVITIEPLCWTQTVPAASTHIMAYDANIE